MQKTVTKPKTVEEYIASFGAPSNGLLKQIRAIIKETAPSAMESIAYNMPAYKQNGPLVYFAGFKNHIGFYPTPSPVVAFKKDLSKYISSIGSVQFPIDQPLPVSLIKKMVAYRVKEDARVAAEKAAVKKKKPAAGKKENDADAVKNWMARQDAPVKTRINSIRKLIRSAAPELNERIKWNAPSYYGKEDVVTFGPVRNGRLMLVFHHPAIVKVKSPILEGSYKSRRLVHFENAAEIKKKSTELTRVLKQLIKLIN